MKPSAFAKLDAKWRARLAREGFQDLEGNDRDAPLSNRGKLHDGSGRVSAGTKVADSDAPAADGDFATFSARVEHGAAYTEWAQDVLQRLNGCRPSAVQRRRIWAAHAAGESLKSISRTQDLNFHVVRDTVRSIEERYKRCSKVPPVEKVANHVETTALLRLTAAVLAALQKGATR